MKLVGVSGSLAGTRTSNMVFEVLNLLSTKQVNFMFSN